MPKPRDEAWAWEYLLRLVARRPYTEAELRQRLIRKDCPPELVESALARAREEGLVDDALFAKLFAEDRLALRPRSRALIAQELRARGVEPRLVRETMASALPELDDLTLARRALRDRLPLWQGLSSEVAARRAFAFLLRRGFGQALAREAVEEMLKRWNRTSK